MKTVKISALEMLKVFLFAQSTTKNNKSLKNFGEIPAICKLTTWKLSHHFNNFVFYFFQTLREAMLWFNTEKSHSFTMLTKIRSSQISFSNLKRFSLFSFSPLLKIMKMHRFTQMLHTVSHNKRFLMLWVEQWEYGSRFFRFLPQEKT